jgi:hypothetical protein
METSEIPWLIAESNIGQLQLTHASIRDKPGERLELIHECEVFVQ